MAYQPTPEERDRQRKAIADFPFERVETSGDRALRVWEQLRTAVRGVPVVLGGDEAFPNLALPFQDSLSKPRGIEDILSAATQIKHPEDLAREHVEGHAEVTKWLKQMQAEGKFRDLANPETGPLVEELAGRYGGTWERVSLDMLMQEPRPPALGEWPAQPPAVPALSVAYDRDDRALDRIHIALVPTDDWTTIPVHLRWGGWNGCPDAEYHVAALRSWRDRFGVELVGLSHDTMNLRIARRPETRAAALDLAREHHVYCNDIIDQGAGTLSNLAAALMVSDWWYFWWD